MERFIEDFKKLSKDEKHNEELLMVAYGLYRIANSINDITARLSTGNANMGALEYLSASIMNGMKGITEAIDDHAQVGE